MTIDISSFVAMAFELYNSNAAKPNIYALTNSPEDNRPLGMSQSKKSPSGVGRGA